jgi:NAD kinase
MIKKILVIYSNKISKTHLDTIESVKKILEEEKCDFAFIDAENIDEKALENYDLIITLGGDGTFVKASNYIKNQLILGINSDPQTSEGALKSIFSHDIEKLRDVLHGNYNIIERHRAEVFLNGKKLNEIVLAVVFVGAASQFHSSRHIIKHNGKEEEQRSSGVLISTGSGSTGWFKSAGGNVFHHGEKNIKFIVREPYHGNRLYKPTILSGDILQDDKIEVICKRDFGSVLAADDIVYQLKKDDKIEVKNSDQPLRVIVLK